jgi:hypothetical protein
MTKEERWVRVQDPHAGTAIDGSKERRAIVKMGISSRDVLPVYFLPDLYHSSFEERLDMRRHHGYGKSAGGMVFLKSDNIPMLNTIVESLSAARIRAWRTYIYGA